MLLTDGSDVTERQVGSSGRVQRVGRGLNHGAVPALVAELMSTLAERQLGSLAGGHHRVRMALAQDPLARRQSGDAVADDTRAERDDRRERAVHEEEGVQVEHGGGDADPPRPCTAVVPVSYTHLTLPTIYSV